MIEQVSLSVTAADLMEVSEEACGFLTKFDLNIDVYDCYDFIAYALTNTPWALLTHTLPCEINFSSHEKLERIRVFLAERGYTVTPDQCADIYTLIYIEALLVHQANSGSILSYGNNLYDFIDQKAPLFRHEDNESSAFPAYVVITPAEGLIRTEIDNDINGSVPPFQEYGHEYAFRVDSRILGTELVQVLSAPDFLHLAEAIAADHSVIHAAGISVGKLGTSGKKALGELTDWFASLNPKLGRL